MGVSLFVGCSLIGFSLVLSIFFLFLVNRTQLLIISLVSGFFWLLSLLLSSVVWIMIPPFYQSDYSILPLSVISVELARIFFIHLYKKTERPFSTTSINAIVFPLRDFYSSLAAGFGFAVMQIFLFYGILISYAYGPAVLYQNNCPKMNVFIVNAIYAALFSLLQISLMINAFDAYRDYSATSAAIAAAPQAANAPVPQLSLWPARGKWLLVWIFHLSAQLLTLLNQVSSGCVYSLIIVSIVVFLSCLWTIFLVTRENYNKGEKQKIN